MKNHKGTVATLLTLGLVLVGSLIIIGVSYLTNNNKIASNPRAANPCVGGSYVSLGRVNISGSGCAPACGGEDKCQECTLGGATKYECKNMGELESCTKARTYASLINCKNDPESSDDSKCTQCLLGYTPRVEYDGNGPPASGGGGEDGGGNGNSTCLITNYNCNEIESTIYKDHVLSRDNEGLYYDGNSCEGTGMNKADIIKKVCDNYKQTTSECFSWDCQIINPNWASKDLLAMGDGNARTYYTDLNSECSSTAYDKDTIVPICYPEAAPTCEETTCGDAVGTEKVDPDSVNKKIYYMSDNETVYYKSKSGGKCTSQIVDIGRVCPTIPPPTATPIPLGIENSIGKTISKDGITYYNCYHKTDNSVFDINPYRLINSCIEFYGDKYQIGMQYDNYYCCKNQ